MVWCVFFFKPLNVGNIQSQFWIAADNTKTIRCRDSPNAKSEEQTEQAIKRAPILIEALSGSLTHSESFPCFTSRRTLSQSNWKLAQQIYIKSERRLSQSRTRLKTYLICLNQIQASRRSAVCSCGLINNGAGQTFVALKNHSNCTHTDSRRNLRIVLREHWAYFSPSDHSGGNRQSHSEPRLVAELKLTFLFIGSACTAPCFIWVFFIFF
jgi:hypothetical protein